MSRSRCTLHFNKLAAFTLYLESRGWIVEPPKSIYEALRMRHPNSQMPCILHKKDSATEHFTSWGLSQELVKDYLRSKK